MTSHLNELIERARRLLFARFFVDLHGQLGITERYPDLFEFWTLVNTIRALATDDAAELHSVNSYAKRGVETLRFRDVHPSGRVREATLERIGLGFAPTLSVSSHGVGTSIWFDKYVGVSLNDYYWPRPDIVIRSGTYDLLKSLTYETHAKGTDYSGGYDFRRGHTVSETVRGWHSLGELLMGDPSLIDYSTELANNFRITKGLVTLISNESGERQALAGHPLDALPTDGSLYVHGQIESDDGVIFWARRMSFLRPDMIIECKSGLLTPHALDQLAAYREIFSSTPLIVVTTRVPDRSVLKIFSDLEIRCVAPPLTLRMDFDETLRKAFLEAKETR
jgi:hypothetical protein